MSVSRVALLVGWLLLGSPMLHAGSVKLGIDVLEERQFAELKGKRVGLITNATGIDSQGNSTVDILLPCAGRAARRAFRAGARRLRRRLGGAIRRIEHRRAHRAAGLFALRPDEEADAGDAQEHRRAGLRHPGHRLPQLHLHQHAGPGDGSGGRGGHQVLRARPAQSAQRQSRRGDDARPGLSVRSPASGTSPTSTA